jgi:hypothetical protein
VGFVVQFTAPRYVLDTGPLLGANVVVDERPHEALQAVLEFRS